MDRVRVRGGEKTNGLAGVTGLIKLSSGGASTVIGSEKLNTATSDAENSNKGR